jgi:hypothetical protein
MGPMPVYSYAQMEQLWIQAGGPKSLAPVAAAIGEAESGGNSDALNPNDNGGTQSSFGIWQISNGTHSPPSPSWANPAVNAQLAVGKWKGAGQAFTPWGTYDSGAYRAFLSSSTSPDPNVPGSPTQLMAQTAAAGASDCLVANPFSASFGIGPVNLGGSLGPSCLFTKSNARAFIGVGFMLAGGFIAGNSTIFILAGLGMRAASALGVLPGGAGKIATGGLSAIVPKKGAAPDGDTGGLPRTEATVPAADTAALPAIAA